MEKPTPLVNKLLSETSQLPDLSVRPVSSMQTSPSISADVLAGLDLIALLKASQTLSSEIEFERVLATLLQIALENTKADKGVLLIPQDKQWCVVAVTTTGRPAQIQTISPSSCLEIPQTLIHTAKHSLESVVITDATTHPVLSQDTYVMQHQPKSLLCVPIFQQAQFVALLYLENQLTIDAFTGEHIEFLKILSTQAAISLENSKLYQEAHDSNQLLEQSLQDLQQVQSKIRETEKLFQTMADSAPVLLWLAGTDTLCYFFNQVWLDFTGRTLAQEMGNGWAEGVHPNDFQRCLDVYLSAFQARESFKMEYRLKRRDGEYRWILDNGVPRFTPDGNFAGYVGSCIDITERRAAEEAVQRKSQELEQVLKDLQQAQLKIVQSEKMASLGNLVAGVAHEINNPIGFLNGSISNGKDYVQDLLQHLKLYRQHYPNPVDAIQDNAEEIDLEFLLEDLPKLLDSMQEATDRIKGISISLCNFSRADTEHTVSADLHEGLDSTLLILKYRLKANNLRPAIQVIQDYGELPTIDCFPGQLNQVFMNILANAIDVFDEEAQYVSLAELQTNPPKIKIKTSVIDQTVLTIQISDNGKGMADDVKARVFDYLYTTKDIGHGTGLGLAIAHQIVVEKHGGSLTVESESGQGTEFCICLPIRN